MAAGLVADGALPMLTAVRRPVGWWPKSPLEASLLRAIFLVSSMLNTCRGMRRLFQGDAGGEREGRGRGARGERERACLEDPAAAGPVPEDPLGDQDPDGHRLTGVRADGSEAGQPLGRTLDRRVRAGRVELDDLAAGPPAGVPHLDADRDAGSTGRVRQV